MMHQARIERNLSLTQCRESWRIHSASVSPTDARSNPVDSLAADEVSQPLGFLVEFPRWRNAKISPLRLWTPPVSSVPVQTR